MTTRPILYVAIRGGRTVLSVQANDNGTYCYQMENGGGSGVTAQRIREVVAEHKGYYPSARVITYNRAHALAILEDI